MVDVDAEFQHRKSLLFPDEMGSPIMAFSEILWPMRRGRAVLLRGQAAPQRRPTEQTLAAVLFKML